MYKYECILDIYFNFDDARNCHYDKISLPLHDKTYLLIYIQKIK